MQAKQQQQQQQQQQGGDSSLRHWHSAAAINAIRLQQCANSLMSGA